MRNNFIGGSSATGGTGNLTLSAAEGLALPAAAFIDGQSIEYSVLQFTDSTLATLAKSESGFGTISSSNVLTRSAPRVTWDGATYSQNAPSALSFSTSNVRVYVAPIAEGGPTAFSARANFTGVYGYGPNEWIIGANLADSADYDATVFTADRLYMVPIRIESGFPITTLGISVTAAASGKSLSACIAAMDPATGMPGNVLLAANGLSVGATGIVSASVTGRILAPGWYWSCFSTNGTPSIIGSVQCQPNPIGSLVSGTRTVRHVTRTRTHANFTVGSSAMSGSSGSPASTVNAAAPVLMWR